MPSHAEIERKYEVDESTAVPDLARVPGVAALEPLEPVELTAVYYDTADRALVRGRIALRRRTGGYDDGWHVKLPAPEGRFEVQAPIETDADAVPQRIRHVVRSRVRDARLEPIATLRTVRRPILLKDASGAARIEVVDDEVRATDHGTGVLRTWREWEAEQVGDDPVASARILDAVEPVLLAAGARPSRSSSKLAQALGALELGDPAPDPAGRRGGATAEAVLRALLADRVEQLHRDELAVLDGGAAEVHAMRKTVRRIRALLGLTDVTGEAGERLRFDLHRTGEVLAEARDTAVASATAARRLDELARSGDAAPDAAQARARLVSARAADAEAARRRALDAFGTPQHFRVLAELERLVAAPLAGPQALLPADEVLPDLARRAARKAARRAAADEHDLPALHRMRKAVRRARYVIEALDEARALTRAPKLLRLARRAERLQDALGEHRDLSALIAELPFASARATADGENGYVYGVLAEQGRREADRLLRTARKAARRLEQAAARAR